MQAVAPRAPSKVLVVAPVRLASSSSSPIGLRDRFGVSIARFRAIAAAPFAFQRADTSTDLHCLTEAVYFEARGEAQAGQQAVAQVVLNRVRHPAFPKSVCAVVHQRNADGCQFSFVCRHEPTDINDAAWRRAQGVASAALHGAVMAAVGDATHFQTARSGPFNGLLRVAQVGAHVFYRFAGRYGAPGMFHQTPATSTAPAVEVASLDVGHAAQAAESGASRAPLPRAPAAPTFAAPGLTSAALVRTPVQALASLTAKAPVAVQAPAATKLAIASPPANLTLPPPSDARASAPPQTAETHAKLATSSGVILTSLPLQQP